MINFNKYIYNYFLFLFSIIPLCLIIGSAVSFMNILLIDLSFIILLIYKKDFYFFKNNTIIYFFVLFIYLIFNSLISIDYSEGILRNLGFVRFIILFVAFNYFYHQKSFFKKMFYFWLLIMLIVVFDVFFEFFYGTNILGYYSSNSSGKRIVSFFKDELIVGSFLYSFFLILIGFFLNEKIKYKYYICSLIFLILISIIVITERSASVKTVIGLIIFLLLYKEINLKNKIIFFFLTSIIIITLLSTSYKINHRYFVQISKQTHTYVSLYKSGFQVFQNNKIFGVGSKNYRVATCIPEEIVNDPSQNKDDYMCTTHPHQIYLEFLSEHGLIGTIIVLLIFYKLIFSKIKKTISEKNYLKIGSLIYLTLSFLPIIPSGAFFGSFTLTLFAINLSLFYASDKNMNIFKIEKFKGR
jgi:O-antigen ligase